MGRRTITHAKEAEVRKYLKLRKPHRWIKDKTGVGLASISRIRHKTQAAPLKVDKDNPFICPVRKLRKADINWLSRHYCNCDPPQPYFLHYGCFIKEKNGIIDEEEVGFIDIEATGLKANFGHIICWCMKPAKGPIIQDCMTWKDILLARREWPKREIDYRVTKSMIAAMNGCDRVVAHYGNGFDIPFGRSRAIANGLNYPEYDDIRQTDSWRIARKVLKIHSNRLDAIGDFFHIEIQKTQLKPHVWNGCSLGVQECLDYVLEHCQNDVLLLEQVYWKLKPYVREVNSSI